MDPLLGGVEPCFELNSGRYVAVRLADLPSTNALTINVGYVYVTPPAVERGDRGRVYMPALLRDGGLDVDHGDEEGKTV